jgi:polyhydroxyalkanoate synthesis regulator phasin
MDRIEGLLRKGILAGIGIPFLIGEKAKDVMDRLAKKGEEVVSEKRIGPEAIKDKVKDKGESIRDAVARVLDLPTRRDYEVLLKKIEGLEALLRKGEGN